MVHKANQTDLITKVKNVKSFTYFIYKYFYQESHKHLKHANALLQKQQVNRKKRCLQISVTIFLKYPPERKIGKKCKSLYTAQTCVRQQHNYAHVN